MTHIDPSVPACIIGQKPLPMESCKQRWGARCTRFSSNKQHIQVPLSRPFSTGNGLRRLHTTVSWTWELISFVFASQSVASMKCNGNRVEPGAQGQSGETSVGCLLQDEGKSVQSVKKWVSEEQIGSNSTQRRRPFNPSLGAQVTITGKATKSKVGREEWEMRRGNGCRDACSFLFSRLKMVRLNSTWSPVRWTGNYHLRWDRRRWIT